MTIEIPDFMQRWIEIDDPWIVGFDWSTHCARTNQPDASTFSTGPGYSIPPTRTPWAWWWSWRAKIANHLFPKSEVIEFYVPYIIPDVCKENPQ